MSQQQLVDATVFNGTLKYRVEQLERGYEKLDEKLDSLMTNHLPHLQQEVESLKTRIAVLTIVNVGALVLALVVNKFL